MSKFTLALIAAVSAATGAGLTAVIYSSHSERKTASQTQPNASRDRPSDLYSEPSTKSPVDPAGIYQYGFPGPVADLAQRKALISSYDRRLRNPHWVAEHITPSSLKSPEADRKLSVFMEDESIPEKFRGKLKDYARSGYDRGHQVPAADLKWSQNAMNETFYLSNMCPQVGEGFNREYWAHFEDFCRRLTQRYPSVRIVTGPLYLPKKDNTDGKWRVNYEVIGNPPNIAVPTHFYKVIFAENETASSPVALGAFVLPNTPIPNSKPITDFEVPLETVERASGLEFANLLPPERRRRLCAEHNCSLVIREFTKRQNQSGGTNNKSKNN
ncbi:Mitochondrial nuclease [Erysiphe necator]|uniref:Endonuclease n=1 Tax=Uncinula necator TaxID=52586 RepID=A0A0B1P5V3_UNCNE|nr:Mitochondrial nuclease [Erysiphe necator]KHJ32059.1 putative mitochondrial nuclease [Erysiphe necator]